ncbi:MAG: S8 family serine peptidase [Lachnospiraceae bacterium]|nr:S8 family serine peptidase [Lachnospiraceae bacterium]
MGKNYEIIKGMFGNRLQKGTALLLSLAMTAGVMPYNDTVFAGETYNAGKVSPAEKISSRAATDEYIDGEIIIEYDNSKISSKSVSKKVGSKFKSKKTYKFESNSKKKNKSNLTVEVVKSDKMSVEKMLKMYNEIDGVTAEPNYKRSKMSSNDTYFGEQWYLENVAEKDGKKCYDINYEKLGSDMQTEENVVAVIDSGIDLDHEDLKNSLWINKYKCEDFDGVNGYDFVNADAVPEDEDGHGTHVAGVIAAKRDNEKGIAGIATNTKIMSLRVLDEEGNGDDDSIIAALEYAYKAKTEYNVNLAAVNMSLGGSAYSKILEDVIERLGESGVLSVCAAGNEGVNIDEDPFDSFPAAFDSEYIISVGASNQFDEPANFSNYGTNSVDLFAPGVDVFSTYASECFYPQLFGSAQANSLLYLDGSNSNLIKVKDNGKSTGTVTNQNQVAYGYERDGNANLSLTQKNGKYRWTITNAEVGDAYYLLFPYTCDSESEDIYEYISMSYSTEASLGRNLLIVSDAKASASQDGFDDAMYDGVLMEPGSDTLCCSTKISSKGKEERVAVIQVYTESGGDFTVDINNVIVSKAGQTSDYLIKYKYDSGTSMATPIVTGAVAALASAGYMENDCLKLKEMILSSTRRSDKLKGMCVTEGVLDLSFVDSQRMIFDNAICDNGVLYITGKYLKDATVEINGKSINAFYRDEKMLKCNVSEYANKQVDLTLKKDSEELTKSIFIDGGKALYGIGSEDCLDGAKAVSIGNEVVIVCPTGEILKVPYNKKVSDYEEYIKGIPNFKYEYLSSKTINKSIFGWGFNNDSSVITFDSEPVCFNGNIYVMAICKSAYGKKKKLLKFNVKDYENSIWENAGVLPGAIDNYNGTQMFTYKGNMYLMGGVNEDGEFLKKAFLYNDDNGGIKETKLFASNMPQRAFARAYQVSDKLVMTLGTDGGDKVPYNMIYDGSSWRKSKQNIFKDVQCNEVAIVDGGNIVTYYKAATGCTGTGIIYACERINNVGNMFEYDVNKDEFTVSDSYIFDNEKFYNKALGIPMLSGNLTGAAANGQFVFVDIWDIAGYTQNIFGKSVDCYVSFLNIKDVKTSEIKVVVDGTKEVTVSGTGSYQPSDMINIRVEVKGGYEIDRIECSDSNIADSLMKYNSFSSPAYNYPNGIYIKIYTKVFSKTDNGGGSSQKETTASKNKDNKTVTITTFTLKTKIVKAKRLSNKKKAKITIRKVANAKGYQIRYSTNRKFTKKTTKTLKTKKTSLTIKKLKKGKKYYVSVRAYAYISGRKLNGKWSACKVIKK